MNGLDELERRVDALEALVFGRQEQTALKSTDKNVLDAVTACSSELKSMTKDQARVKDTFSNLPKLKSLLDPDLARRETQDLRLAATAILADEERIRGVGAELDRVVACRAALDSAAIAAVPGLTGRLNALTEVALDQQCDAKEVTEETEQLLMQYNDAVNSLTKQFAAWDCLITRLEMEAQVKEDVYI